MAARLELRALTRRYDGGGGIESVDLDVASGELLAITGPSGSGKSTLVRLVAGLESPNAGAVLLDARDVTKLAPHERDIGMTFDDGALYEHLDVRHNVEAGLDRRGIRGAVGRATAIEALTLVGAAHLKDRRPESLSAGERRRVALARAVARKPALLLLDEPLTHLDRAARLDLREDVRAAQRAIGATTLLVTHDHEDAIAIADRVAFLSAGRVRQVGVAAELLARPLHVAVAQGFGPQPMNLVAAPDGGTFGFRPDDVRLQPQTTGQPEEWSAEGTILHRGGGSLTFGLADGTRVRTSATPFGTSDFEVGRRVRLAVASQHLHRFDQSGDRIR